MLSTVYCLSFITLHSALCTSSFLAFGRAASYHSSLKLFSDIQAGEGLRSLRALGRGLTAALLGVVCLAAGCRQVKETTGLSVAPKELRDVPADRLLFRFETDVSEKSLPDRLRKDEPEELLATIKAAFETERKSDALIRTVLDPTGQRARAL